MLRARTIRPHCYASHKGGFRMAKGQEKKATNNKAKLSVKEKKAKKQEKAAKK
jgi:hypothetical protein